MNQADKKEFEITDLVLQLSRAAYAQSNGDGLTQAQWVAMYFFSRANRFSRTVSGFARFHVTTKGTASQTVKTLVQHEYLARSVSDRDARSIRFDLTAAGRKKLKQNPLARLVQVAAALQEADKQHVLTGLRTMFTDIYADATETEADVCQLCGHLDKGSASSGPRCKLMNETLREAELTEVCVRFKRA